MKITIFISLIFFSISLSCQEPDTLIYVSVDQYDSLLTLYKSQVNEKDSLFELLLREIEKRNELNEFIFTDSIKTIIYSQDYTMSLRLIDGNFYFKLVDENNTLRIINTYSGNGDFEFMIMDSTKTIFNPVLNLDKLIYP